MRFTLVFLIAVGCALAFLQGAANAGPGVGVSISEIKVNERLAPGGRYELPSIAVLNTGDEPGLYRLRMAPPGSPSSLVPDQGWFEFAPDRFHLAPGESRPVSVSLILPRSTPPGNYFAYLQASPMLEIEGASIGIAAATKLEFTVRPSSFLDAWRVWLTRHIDAAQPWPTVMAVLVLAFLALRLVSRRVEVTVRRR